MAPEYHRLVTRDLQSRFVLGPWLVELASSATENPLLATTGPTLARLHDITGESAQLLHRQGDFRIRSTTIGHSSGLWDTVPLGAQPSMTAGSAAQVLLAWEELKSLPRLFKETAFTMLSLQQVRHRGWAQSVVKHEPGVASISVPVLFPSGKVIATVSVSGPIGRLTRQPGRPHAPAVMAAAECLSKALCCNGTE